MSADEIPSVLDVLEAHSRALHERRERLLGERRLLLDEFEGRAPTALAIIDRQIEAVVQTNERTRALLAVGRAMSDQLADPLAKQTSARAEPVVLRPADRPAARVSAKDTVSAAPAARRSPADQPADQPADPSGPRAWRLRATGGSIERTAALRARLLELIARERARGRTEQRARSRVAARLAAATNDHIDRRYVYRFIDPRMSDRQCSEKKLRMLARVLDDMAAPSASAPECASDDLSL